ncbi:MAG TPA: hypothetical protein VFV98_01155 [Vicinamibacterales bacterium]|nr:hypothetical protein [Vicinamibacterales bacterium]
MVTFLHRLFGASVLDQDVYEELEHTPATIGQAGAVVILASVAAGIGAGLSGGGGVRTIAAASAISVVLWLAWAMLAFQIGTRLLPEAGTHATWGELLRTTGFAAGPGLLQVFGAITPWPWTIFIASWIWMFAAMAMALQRALDYRHVWRAFAVAGASAALILLIVMLAGVAMVAGLR